MIRYLRTPVPSVSITGLTEDSLRLVTVAMTVANTTVSVSPTTGALVVVGGVGIGGNLNVDGNITGDDLTALSANITTNLAVLGTIQSGTVSAGFITAISGNIGIFSASSVAASSATFQNLTVTNFANLASFYASSGTFGSLIGNTIGAQDINSTVMSVNTLRVDSIIPRNGTQVNLGSVGNLRITGGSSGQVLTTDGNGNLTWSSAPSALIFTQGLVRVGNTVRLTTTGVSPGTYTQVTVDAYGRVTAGVGSAETLDSVAQRSGTTSAQILLTNETESNDISEGALVVLGGVGIAGRLVAANIVSQDGLTVEGNLSALSAVIVNNTLYLDGPNFGAVPLQFATGLQPTPPGLGAVEFDGDNLYITTNAGRQLIQVTDTGTAVDNAIKARAVALYNIDISAATQIITVNSVEVDAWDEVILNAGDRVLVPFQTDTTENGVYTWNGEGQPLTRATDFNEITGIYPGTVVFVAAGDTYQGSIWQVDDTGPITVGTSPVIFSENYGQDSIALSNLPKDLSAGLVTRTRFGNIVLRSIRSTSSWITVSNADGRTGNVTLSTGIVPVAAGGTGRASIWGYMRGSGTSIVSSNTIPVSNIAGIGTLAVQNANNVSITDGNITANILVANTATINGNLFVSDITVANITVTNSPTFFVNRGNDPSNWNQNITLGVYYVNRLDWSGTSGTPTEAYTQGLLTVLNAEGMVAQKYQPNDTSSIVGSEWFRTRNTAGVWTEWSRAIGDNGRLDGGSF